MADVEADGIFINGEPYSMRDLSYREQRQVRDEVAKIAPEGDIGQATELDIIPAFVYVVRKRAEPEFTIDMALDVKPADLEPPAEPKEGKAPPRKPRSS